MDWLTKSEIVGSSTASDTADAKDVATLPAEELTSLMTEDIEST